MQTRTTRQADFQPTRPEDPRLTPTHFDLILTITPQSRRTDREAWKLDPSVGQTDRKILIGNMTRREVAHLIATAADWMAYLGDEA